jgi:hypothetical protein
MAKQEAERRFTGQPRRLLPVFAEPCHVDVGNEVVGIGAREHKYLERAVSLGSLNQRNEIAGPVRSQEDSSAGPQCP